MACLVPQFKCPSISSDAYFRSLSHHHSLNSKARDSVCFRSQCVSTPTPAVIDFEHILSLEAHSTSSAATRPLTYVGAIGPPMKANIEASLATEALLTGEEEIIAAAAAEAVALARTAVEAAKDAALTIANDPSVKLGKSSDFSSEADILQLERSTATDTKPHEEHLAKDPSRDEDISNLVHNELEPQKMQYSESIAVRSGRRTERIARRARAAEKAASSVIPVKSGSSSKKKRSAIQEIDYSDPLRYLRGTTSTSKLLTAAEELELSEGIQDLLKLERLREELAERNGAQPTFAQWAAAAGVDRRTLRKHLNHGTFCKDKMITSNIRLVISIAKNYQGAGMNLQDLVQEGCRGLVKGAEKFDGSKGFKFSTYAHWWIKQAVRRSLSEQSRTIRLPFHMVEATYRVREAEKQLYNENGRHPDYEEVAEATGLSMKRLNAVMLTPKAPRSLDQKIAKARDSVCFRSQCVSTPTPAVIDFEHILSLEAHSTSSAATRPLTYVGAIGPPMKANIEASLATEALLTGEEEIIAAAAAEAVALARTAVEAAKDAALTIANDPSVKLGKSSDFSSEADILQLERSTATDTKPHEEHLAKDPSRDEDISNLVHNELEPQKMQYSESIAVRSGRRTERIARRARAAEKAASSVIPVKSGSSSKKKRSAIQEIDYSDPLRYLRGTTSTSKLLTAAEELELSEGIQDLLKLERLREELAERNGAQPTFAQWAAAAGVDRRTLRKHLNHGTFCKDKMITSNIRLVISIAKNYQGAGMNLQDLVQEGCRGLVKGAEKFDGSKGFKFSTYAHWWIKQAVRRSLSEQSRTIRLPFHMVEATYRVREAEKQLYNENGRHPDYEEVAEATGLSMKRLNAVMLTPKAPRSLDQKIGINQSLKLSEVIADPEAETSEEILIKQFMKQDLNKVLNSLNPREKQVIRWRFGLKDGMMKTLQEIGELMGVSRERIRQIESNAFRKLKSKKRTKNLQQYINP
ncbi:putative RNA polymerase sigma factor sigB [Cocos nucifera]|uniref:Putative RNA polymerase sigma factor sigB n=1 Tax=Cocos nucifera TaxID=13894 RepID=A0A8K0IME0_COCNU|nr:putative RNA polymerase sigma factor sigB [Cocos nucifera]